MIGVSTVTAVFLGGVDYLFTIILNNFIHKDSDFKKTLLKYNLFATCTHLGSPSDGHYIAYTKHKDVWYLKDDTRCIKINSVPLIDFHYILMYKQI